MLRVFLIIVLLGAIALILTRLLRAWRASAKKPGEPPLLEDKRDDDDRAD